MKMNLTKKTGLALLASAPLLVFAQITTAPNNAAMGTAVPPSAFPNPTNPTTPPTAFPPGTVQQQFPDPLAPQRQSWQMQAPSASTSTVPPTLPSTSDGRILTPTSTPTCSSVQANGQPCVQQ